MKNKLISKILLLTIVGTFTVSSLVPNAEVLKKTNTNILSKLVQTNANDYTSTINNSGYITEIETIYIDNETVEFKIKENGSEYIISYDLKNETATVNEKTYSLDTIFKVSDLQIEQIKASTNKKSSLNEVESLPDIIENFESIKTIEKKQNINIENRSSYPTTGYGKEYFGGSFKKLNISYAITGSVLSVIAAFVFKGNVQVSTQFVKGVMSGAVSAGLVGSINDTIHGDQYYDMYQSYHSTTSAVKERRVPYAKIQNTRFDGDDYTWYFWSDRPE